MLSFILFRYIKNIDEKNKKIDNKKSVAEPILENSQLITQDNHVYGHASHYYKNKK